MSVTLERMRYWVRKEVVGTDSQELGVEDIDELLNFSLWNIESQFPFRTRERCVTTETVAGQSEYDLSSVMRLDAITSIALTDSDGVRHKLARMTRDWLDANLDSEDIGLPTRYLREANKLTLFPTPEEGGFRLTIHFRQSVESLLEGQVETTGLPRNWDEIVISGAVWRGHKAMRRYEEMAAAMRVTGALINMTEPVEEKEKRDSRYARVDVMWEGPEDDLMGNEGY